MAASSSTFRRSAALVAALSLLSLMVAPSLASGHPRPADRNPILGHYQNIVVIFQENHSFDNLYGGWGKVGRDRVEGVDEANAAERTQVDQAGKPFACLPQVDVNLTSPPLASACSDPAHGITQSAFVNEPFTIDDYIAPTDTTCPAPGAPTGNGTLKGTGLEGGCTRDLVHRFYQEKYQINHGQQNRYVTGSDALGLTMGVYDTTQLPIYEYLHGPDAPHYVIADRFFQGANGGSFLNHQWLIAGRAPYVDAQGTIPTGATRAANSITDSNGMPVAYPYYTPTYETPTQDKVKDAQLTVACPKGEGDENYAKACGNFAVNTVQPASAPRGGGAVIPLIDDAKYPNIGDRLTDRGVSWAWYSGGWDDAEAGHPGPLFQYHHQPFNYYADYAPNTPGRAHLQDADHDFLKAAVVGNLPRVSFVKPYGAENEHPGYASASGGSAYLVKLIQAVLDGPQADDTLIVVTYNEFGGQWDHVSPPGKGSPTKGAYDAFGPGTRIPALLLSADMNRSGVDHTVYDTTSIITSLESSFHLAPVGIRDRRVPDLRRAVEIGNRHHR